MNLKLALCALCVAGVLQAQEPDLKKFEVTKTDNIAFPEGGTLRVENSTGELVIEGWDQPGAEITIRKSSKDFVRDKDEDRTRAEFEHVRVSAKVSGDEVVVSTEFQKHKVFPWFWPLSDNTDFDLSCHIRVPRSARVVVKQDNGEVHVIDVNGNVQVNARQGLISVELLGDAPRTIDAKSDIGSVKSDYAAKGTGHPWVFGNAAGNASGAAQKLSLRMGFGDILILKQFDPELNPKSPGLPSGN